MKPRPPAGGGWEQYLKPRPPTGGGSGAHVGESGGSCLGVWGLLLEAPVGRVFRVCRSSSGHNRFACWQVAAVPGLWWSTTALGASTSGVADVLDWAAMEAPLGERTGALMAAVRSNQSGSLSERSRTHRSGMLVVTIMVEVIAHC
jgi:hypothetical protein